MLAPNTRIRPTQRVLRTPRVSLVRKDKIHAESRIVKKLSDRDFDDLVECCNNPPAPNEALLQAANLTVSSAPGNVSERGLAAIIERCENPPKPNAALMKAAKKYCSR